MIEEIGRLWMENCGQQRKVIWKELGKNMCECVYDNDIHTPTPVGHIWESGQHISRYNMCMVPYSKLTGILYGIDLT